MKPVILEQLKKFNINIIPLKPNTKEPATQWQAYQSTKCTENIPPESNIGVICGETSGNLAVIDIDFQDRTVIDKIIPDALERTLVVKSGKGGYHIYVRSNKLPKTMRLENQLGRIDIQSQGTYVVGPSSIHPNGNVYEIISTSQEIANVNFDTIIENLNIIGFETKQKPVKEILKGGIEEGSRHNSALKYACHLLFKTNLEPETVQYELQRWNSTNKPPLSKNELDQIIHDAIEYHNQIDESNNPEMEIQRDESIFKLPISDYEQRGSEELTLLRNTIESNFPNRSFAIEVGLSVKVQMKIEGITQPLALFFMGSPSTYKSTILEILDSLPNSYLSDSFTPKSFVSHSANSKKEDLEKIDLLPKIKHKTLITPELAPLFSGNQDQLVEYFGMLTRILDGRGFQSDSGVHGKRGYSGDYYFTWLGAVIDIPHRVWGLLGNLGPKMYFFRLPEDTKSDQEKLDQIKRNLKENSYVTKLESSKDAIKKFWNFIENRPEQNENKVIWNTEKDDEESMNRIIQLAMVLSKLRATIPTWNTLDSGGSQYNFEIPTIENPSRASSAFYNLARGHALLCGRNYITKEDLCVVIPTALSSAPKERVELFRLLIENNGKVNTDEFKALAKVSRATALKEIQKLTILGLVTSSEEDATTKKVTAIKLKDEFGWFLTSEFKQYWDQFKASLTTKSSKLSQEKENLEINNMSLVE